MARSEVFWQALWRRIIFFPFRLFNNITYRLWRVRLRFWRIWNVDVPYQKRVWRERRGR